MTKVKTTTILKPLENSNKEQWVRSLNTLVTVSEKLEEIHTLLCTNKYDLYFPDGNYEADEATRFSENRNAIARLVEFTNKQVKELYFEYKYQGKDD